MVGRNRKKYKITTFLREPPDVFQECGPFHSFLKVLWGRYRKFLGARRCACPQDSAEPTAQKCVGGTCISIGRFL